MVVGEITLEILVVEVIIAIIAVIIMVVVVEVVMRKGDLPVIIVVLVKKVDTLVDASTAEPRVKTRRQTVRVMCRVFLHYFFLHFDWYSGSYTMRPTILQSIVFYLTRCGCVRGVTFRNAGGSLCIQNLDR